MDGISLDSFNDLSINPELVKKLADMEITKPMEVQKKVIPLVSEGKNVIVQAPTGSGKTLAYLLPLLSKIELTKNLQVLILTPTRELAMQVVKVIREFGDNFYAVPLLGGGNFNRQVDSLKKKPQIIVGTPGRVLEFIKKKKLNVAIVKTLVIDEADKMLTHGFKDDITEIVKNCMPSTQLLFFSATITPTAAKQAAEMAREAELVNIAPATRTAPLIEHLYFSAEENKKSVILQKLVQIFKPQKIIVFITNNRGVGPLTRRLKELGLNAIGLHSDMPQLNRKNVLESFRKGKYFALITTDLFSRGMDVEGVDFVFNYDLPENEEYYIHRVGRTGRGGKKGTAISLVTEKQKFIIKKYEKKLHIKIAYYGIFNDNKVFPVQY
ncbi:DEAD/DEAH box helicase [Bacillota bacterium LX-D]|nr:DEAD/DEAH box helicase [Bacillota bacterium LX-D]